MGEENVEKHLAMESKVLMDADAETLEMHEDDARPWFAFQGGANVKWQCRQQINNKTNTMNTIKG